MIQYKEKMRMKKFITMMLTLLMVFSLAACGNSEIGRAHV